MAQTAGSRWRIFLALLVAALTILTFADPSDASRLIPRDPEEQFTSNPYDVQIVLRNQEPLDRSLRCPKKETADIQDDGCELMELPTFAAWLLPAPSASRCAHHAERWRARGPPKMV